MGLPLRLLLYVGVTAGLFAALAFGVLWLVSPDPSLRQSMEAKAAPVPPRIADSIERRIAVPAREPQQVTVAPPAPLQQSNVALTTPPAEQKPARRFGTVKVVRPDKGSGMQHKEPPSVQTYVVPLVTTGRTDFPF